MPYCTAPVSRTSNSAVAAALKPTGFKARGVLTLQGSQSIGKTSWISALMPDQVLREICIKLDHHLDASNKDSLITAVSHWIVEIGELDSSFKKDKRHQQVVHPVRACFLFILVITISFLIEASQRRRLLLTGVGWWR